MPSSFNWSEQTITRMAELWKAGISTTGIARVLGTSKNAVVGKTHRLHDVGDPRFPPRPSPIRHKSDTAQPAAKRAKSVILPPLPSEKTDNIVARDKVIVNTLQPEPAPMSVPTDEEPVIFMPPARPPEPTQARVPPRGLPPCCWPIGEPGKRDFRFCGEPVEVLGRPYCEDHSRLAYVKVKQRGDEQRPSA